MVNPQAMCRILPFRIVYLSTMILMGFQVHAQTPGRNFEILLDSLKSLAGNSLDDSLQTKLFGQVSWEYILAWEYILDGDYDLAWQFTNPTGSPLGRARVKSVPGTKSFPPKK